MSEPQFERGLEANNEFFLVSGTRYPETGNKRCSRLAFPGLGTTYTPEGRGLDPLTPIRSRVFESLGVRILWPEPGSTPSASPLPGSDAAHDGTGSRCHRLSRQPVTAPSAAEPTSRAYLARAPVW